MSMEYNTMMITGQKIFRNDSLTFGQAYDQDMQPIYEVHAAHARCAALHSVSLLSVSLLMLLCF